MLRVVAGAVLSARGVLLVSKRIAPAVFYLPGGKPEPGEDARTCLERELHEELGVDVVAAEPLLDVRATAALERTEMAMSVFLTTVRGTPAAKAEISQLAWWPQHAGIELAPAVRDGVIPHLRGSGHLPPDSGVRVRNVHPEKVAALRGDVLRPGQAKSKPDDGDPDAAFFAARASDGRVLSTVNVRPAPPPWEPAAGGWWQLRGMATAEGERGRGYAHAVVAEALRHVDRAGGRVWCNARTSALGFYRRFAFSVVGEEWTDPVSGPHRSLTRLELH